MATGVARAATILLKSGTIDPQGQSGRPKARLMATAGAPAAKGGLYIIQHEGAIPPGWRRQLVAAGARIRGYVPENAYIIEVPGEAYAKVEAVEHAYLGAYRAADRIEPTLRTEGDMICVISLFDAAARDTVRARLASVPGAEAIRADGKAVRARLSADARNTVAGWDEVEYVTPYLAPKLYNDVAVGDEFMNVRTVWPNGGAGLGLSGTGQVVAVADTGLDSRHPDFGGQVLRAYALARKDDWSDMQGHGTHVAGSVLGRGVVSNDIRGVAWGAKLIMQSVGDAGAQLGGIPDDLNDLFSQAYVEENGLPGARIHSDSWGASPGESNALPFGWYSAHSRDVDEFTFSHPDMCILFAAGNEGKDELEPLGVVDGNTLASPGTAKNCITVGASESLRSEEFKFLFFNPIYVVMDFFHNPIANDLLASPCDGEHQGMAAFSNRGPCQDGRIKPDIVAPGTGILSTKRKETAEEDYGYVFDSGTSMATPLTAGASALVREWLDKRFGISNPDGATVKAVLMAGVYPALTSTDAGMVETDYDVYSILSNAEVTVTFAPFENYRIAANGTKAWMLTGDVTFGETEGFPLPTVEGIPGTDVAPWIVGEGVQAYTNETGELFITGTGAMDDFASAADVPWDPASVTEVTIGEGVTKIGANAWAGLSGDVVVDGGLPLSRYALVGGGFATPAAPAAPSGAVSAEFDAVQIVDGKAYLGVSVYTNSEVKATDEGWGVATNGVIEVPAEGKSGFFYLMSKPAQPSNAPHSPIFIPQNIEE